MGPPKHCSELAIKQDVILGRELSSHKSAIIVVIFLMKALLHPLLVDMPKVSGTVHTAPGFPLMNNKEA